MTVIDKILSEWSYRCSDGIVDMNNPTKRAILNAILEENGVDLEEARPKKEIPVEEEDTSDIGKIISTLKSSGIRKDVLDSIKNILLKYDENQLKNFISKFKTYSVNDIDIIYKTFSDFFNITTKGLGRGEVMLIIGLKDSKSGGQSSKDIEINGKIYEVKELSTGEFNLASDGYIGGTTYLQNLTTLKKYLTKEIVPALDITN